MKIDLTKGYIDLPIDNKLDLHAEISKLKKEKNAVILAHFYVEGELQDLADFVGDSLALSQQAAKTNADIIVFLGVHFMAETAKILSPDKKVIIPDLNAGCSLADSCPTPDFEKFVKDNPDHVVVTYVNSTAEVKAFTDIICTSSNAKEIVESIPEDKKIIFAPDKNLGNYISRTTGREMLIWDGACHVHHEFSLPGILKLKAENPDAKIIAHPECPRPVLEVSDFVGSTSALLKFTQTDQSKTYIVATEPGILHQMQKNNLGKEYLAAPGEDISCACNECNFMKLNTLAKLYNALKYEQPEVNIDADLRVKALKPIQRMLDISQKLGL